MTHNKNDIGEAIVNLVLVTLAFVAVVWAASAIAGALAGG